MTVALALGAPGCGTGDEAGSAAWEFTRRTDGEVTTVVTTAGSKWGGPARLVEELSIGVLEGEEPYMFGAVSAIWATDEAVYVADATTPAVRVFDRQGRFLRQIGRPGSGPGEYERPFQLAVRDDGRVYVVRGERNPGVEVFGPDGEHIETLNLQTRSGSSLRVAPVGLTVTLDDRLFVSASERPSDPGRMRREDIRRGVVEIGPDGPTGSLLGRPDFDFEPPTIRVGNTTMSMPYAPRAVAAFSPTGAWIAGVATDYSFEVHDPDGSITRVERYWDPVLVSPEENAYRKRRFVEAERRYLEGSTFEGEFPARKPAYRSFIPDRSGRVLVSREGPSRRVDDCDENADELGAGQEPCWVAGTIRDLFDLGGDYLGEVVFPERDWQFSAPFIRDDEFWFGVVDEAGNVTARMFRLVPPSDPSSG